MCTAPAARVQCAFRKKRTRAYRYQRKHSGIPCAMVLRLIPCSPRRRIRLVTVADRLAADRARLGRKTSASLTPATGARTTRLCRTRLHRSSARQSDRSRTKARPAPFPRDGAAASTASLPAFVTIAKRPSCRGGMARAGSADLPDGESEIFFASGIDRKMPDGQIRRWIPIHAISIARGSVMQSEPLMTF